MLDARQLHIRGGVGHLSWFETGPRRSDEGELAYSTRSPLARNDGEPPGVCLQPRCERLR